MKYRVAAEGMLLPCAPGCVLRVAVVRGDRLCHQARAERKLTCARGGDDLSALRSGVRL